MYLETNSFSVFFLPISLRSIFTTEKNISYLRYNTYKKVKSIVFDIAEYEK